MIGIIGAMEEEVAAIKEYMVVTKETKLLDNTIYIGTIENIDVILLQGGIGKVNTAICCTMLFQNYPAINKVLNIGSAGGLLPSQNVGDVIISSDVMYHDVDITAFGHPIGKISGLPLSFKADQELIDIVKKVVDNAGLKASIGTIVSGDQFIASDKQVTFIKEHFPEAMCAEMEAASIGHTCYKFNIPFIITRSLSDVFGKGDSSIQFDEYLKKASVASAKMCVAVIKELNNEK